MFQASNFVAAVAEGRAHVDGGQRLFACERLLGTAFVATRDGWCISCNHVVGARSPDLDLIVYLLSGTTEFTIVRVEPKSIVRWPDRDLVAFRLQLEELVSPPTLAPLCFDTRSINLGERLWIIGLPEDRFGATASDKVVNLRVLTGFVVSSYAHDTEVDCGIITGMSGGPVVDLNDRVVGLAYLNRAYSFDERVQVSTVVHGSDGVPEKRETYRYEETQRFGVFYRVEAFLDWLRTVTGQDIGR